jgi:hypothetical protein
MKSIPTKRHTKRIRGFVLPFTLLICSILLSVATAISVVLVKELYFSKISRDSQTAYYAADNGMECAIMIDDTYTDPNTGLGIFESNPTGHPRASNILASVNTDRQAKGLPALTLAGNNSIKCATSEIFNASTNGFTVTAFPHTNAAGQAEDGSSSSFTLHMDLGGGLQRCAKVTVNKTPHYRQIISQGYTFCPGGAIAPIERAIINETELK